MVQEYFRCNQAAFEPENYYQQGMFRTVSCMLKNIRTVYLPYVVAIACNQPYDYYKQKSCPITEAAFIIFSSSLY
jgi:hypothetical protein